MDRKTVGNTPQEAAMIKETRHISFNCALVIDLAIMYLNIRHYPHIYAFDGNDRHEAGTGDLTRKAAMNYDSIAA
jgi:hypothetical protein